MYFTPHINHIKIIKMNNLPIYNSIELRHNYEGRNGL